MVFLLKFIIFGVINYMMC